MVKGVTLNTEVQESGVCVPCIKGKNHRLPIPKETSTATKRILELIHTDLCGPVNPPSLGGSLYVLTLTDDYSRTSWVRFLQKKSEVAEEFKNWTLSVEKQCVLRSIRCNDSVQKFVVYLTQIPILI